MSIEEKQSPPVLIVNDDSLGLYRILWYFPKEDDTGAAVGEGVQKDLEKSSGADWDHCAAWYAVQSLNTYDGQDSYGFFWLSESRAEHALRVCLAYLKENKTKKPWPAWAVQARAAGWSPPDEWEP